MMTTMMKTKSKVEVIFKGKTYQASYSVSRGMVTARSICGDSSVHIGGLTEAWAAKEALHALLLGAEASDCLDTWPTNDAS